MSKLLFAAIVLSLVTLNSQADPVRLIVVEDLGGVSAQPYYSALNIAGRPEDFKIEKKIENVPVPEGLRYDESSMLPVVSNKLSPGRIEARLHNARGLVRPIFLVGNDKLSIAWLRQRGDALRAMQAVGFAVDVQDMKALESIRAAGADLVIMPASGDQFAEQLGIQHYPVLITPQGIEQ